MKYCIDSCSFIELGDTFRPTVFPTIMPSIAKLVEEQRVYAATEVYEELKRQEGDKIFEWVRTLPGLFVLPSSSIQRAVKDILRTYPRLIDYKTGKSGADPWVIATAQVESLVVVTEEQLSGSLSSPKIPDVCRVLGVDCIRMVEFLEREGLLFR